MKRSPCSRTALAQARRCPDVCLQHLIHEVKGVHRKNLNDEIDEVSPSLPQDLAACLHAIRKVGNLGAHPMKAEDTEDLLEVEPSEAVFMLELLERLFVHWCVEPARNKALVASINAKYASAEKPPKPPKT